VLILCRFKNWNFLPFIPEVVDHILKGRPVSIEEYALGLVCLFGLGQEVWELKHTSQFALRALCEDVQASHDSVSASQIERDDLGFLLFKSFDRLSVRN